MAARHCCVPLCTSTDRKRLYFKNYKVSFHRFPTEEKRQKAWKSAIFMEEGNDVNMIKVQDRNTVVCSKHFVDADIQRSLCRRRQVLKPGAIPKVFPWAIGEEDMPAPKAARSRKCLKKPNPQASSGTESATLDAHTEPDEAEHAQRLFKKRGIKKLDVKQYQQEHDYSSRNYAYFTPQERLEAAAHYIEDLKARILDLQSKRFCLDRFSLDSDLISFYTGFPSYELVRAAFLAFRPTAERMTQCSWNQCCHLGDTPVTHQAFCHENLALIDQFFLFLVKVKRGSIDQDLAFRFGVSVTCVGQVILTWANYLYALLGAMPIWLSRSQIDESMPACFKAVYSNTRVILDSAELKIESASTSDSNSRFKSNHKETITCKGLFGITPAGGVSFVSTLFTSPISNKELTIRSLISQLLDPGDQVMVDKHFSIQSVLSEIGASLLVVPACRNSHRSSILYREETRCIKCLRSNVERGLQRVSEYRIFDELIPLTIANQIWTVCCLLTNFKGPLL